MNTILLLLALALVFFFVEIFAPGGVLGFIGVILIFSAAVVGYQEYGLMPGFGVLFGGLLVAGLFFYVEMRFILKTGVGQRIFSLQSTQASRVGYEEERVSALVGKTGESVTRMTPTGKVTIDGEIYSAVCLDGYLAKGTPVMVKEANPSSIKVSPL